MPNAESSQEPKSENRPSRPNLSKPRTGGRPEKYTPAVHDKIVLAVRAGNYLKVAAAAAGIGESTLLRWMSSPRYRKLQAAVRQAQAEYEVRTIGQIASRPDIYPTAALKVLSRRYPSRWGLGRETGAGPEDKFPEIDRPIPANHVPTFFDNLPPDWRRVIAAIFVASRQGETAASFFERKERGMDPGLREGDLPRKWYELPEADDEETPAGNE